MTRMKELYQKTVIKEIAKELGLSNVHQIPKITKVVVNAGIGRASLDTKKLEPVLKGLAEITGQAPVVTKAKKSIAGFKLREGMSVGATVTLRGDMMYEFLDRLVSVALPRVRDFRGLKRDAFDGHGNYSLGIREHGVGRCFMMIWNAFKSQNSHFSRKTPCRCLVMRSSCRHLIS